MVVLGGSKIADRLRWHLRRQEATLGAILALLLAVTTVAVVHIYY
jgi:hypothetical protein